MSGEQAGRKRSYADMPQSNFEVYRRGGTTRDIALFPQAGRYPLKCGHAFHKLLGMSGEIVVE